MTSSVRCPSAERHDDVDPVRLARCFAEELGEPLDDRTELARPDSVDQDHPAVRAPCLGPAAKDLGEVRHVVRHEDAALRRGQGQDVFILESLSVRVVAERTRVVALCAQLPPDPRSG